MPQIINTNVPSLNTQRSLNSSQSALSTSLQRLSSGLRINSAKDDAAGLAISERFSSQIRGLDQARRNANDGVSMSQTAEGALESSGDILQRVRELAVQSSNATNSSSDRQAIQAEVSQLTQELDRIAKTTQFNGQNLLDGTSGTLNFQVGANAGQTISASTANFRTNVYGNNRVQADAAQAKLTSTNVASAKKITIDGFTGSGSYTTVAGDTAQSIAAGVNTQTYLTGVTATAKTEVNLSLGAEAYSLKLTSDNTVAVAVSFTVGTGADSADDFASAISNINAVASKTGVTAEYDTANGGLKLTNASGNDITVTNAATVANTKLNASTYKVAGGLVASPLDIKAAGAVGVANGTVTFNSTNGFKVTDAGSGLALDVNMASGASVTGSSYLDAVSTLDVTTFKGAQLAIQIVDSALSAVNNQRAQFGALQSRFESTVTNLQTTSENLSASRSRIRDADFAEETSKLARNQVLQQAGMAMLSQANAMPQNVLSLLR